MRSFQSVLAAPLVVLTIFSSSVFAEGRHAVPPAALATAVSAHAAAQESDRAAVREALTRPEVRDLAGRMGVDLEQFNASMATLAGEDLNAVAGAARQVNQAFAGGASTVVISTTTIIIALLLIILVVVAT